MRRFHLILLTAILINFQLLHGMESKVTSTIDESTGWTIYTISNGKTEARIAPEAGCNVFSIKHDGIELLGQAPSMKEVAGFHHGNPILYPSPNRVRDSQFTFENRTYKFTPNDGKNFLHGIVHNAAWEVVDTITEKDEVTLQCRLNFKPGSKLYDLFPLNHSLKYDVSVKDGSVTCRFTVDNSTGKEAIPFGFALHPWFLYQGARKQTYLTVPAGQHMELDETRPEELLPSGKLTNVTGGRFDCQSGRSLDGWIVDDVWYGMTPDKPARIEFRDKKISVELKATEEFTHLVVYTPADQPWFCVENQTCSTDAHNLHSKGVAAPSHLLIVPPGKSKSGAVEFRIQTD